MRLSEAMMLGSATVKMVAGDWNSCALGAACNALGLPKHGTRLRLEDLGLEEKSPMNWMRQVVVDFTDRPSMIRGRWPWVGTETSTLPAFCDGVISFEEPGCTAKYGVLITTIFDTMVVAGKLTLEQLVDWVCSVEPECGECCRFDCDCQSAEPEPVATDEKAEVTA